MIAYLDCVGGAAGDMLLAALLDAGAEAEVLHALPERLGLPGVEVRVSEVERHGCGALHVAVLDSGRPADGSGHAHAHGRGDRSWPELRALVERAELAEEVRARSLAVLRRLAEAEARVHRVEPEQVHFHELGAVDTLVDVCGAVSLLAALGVERVTCSPLPLGRGQTRAAHGLLPLPSPATLELLAGVPVVGLDVERETVTPTGAALVSTLAEDWGPLPPLVLRAVGTGAGTADPADRANVVRVLLGEARDAVSAGEVSLLETNLDDLVPELVPDAAARCFAAGALDVWTVPAQMKKGRPALVLSALARPADEPAVARAILEETSALGVRVARLARYELERAERVVELDGGSVRVKLGLLDGRVVNVAPEHDDCAELARATGRPVKAIWAAALAAAHGA